MSYRLVEHYNDAIEEDSLIGECFVCYEFKIENEEVPINLKHQCYYFKICSCNGWIHATCLNTWCLKTNNCPICRTPTTKINKLVAIILNNNWFLTTIYVIFIRYMIRILRFIFFTFTIFYFIETIRFVNNTYNTYNTYNTQYYYIDEPGNLYYDEYTDTCTSVILNDYLFTMTPTCHN